MGCRPELAWRNTLDNQQGRMYFFFSKVGWISCFSSARTRPGGGEETLPGKREGVLWPQQEWLAPCLPGPENCSSVWDGICSEACNGGTVQLGVPRGNSATGKEGSVWGWLPPVGPQLVLMLPGFGELAAVGDLFGLPYRVLPLCEAWKAASSGRNGSCKEQVLPCPVPSTVLTVGFSLCRYRAVSLTTSIVTWCVARATKTCVMLWGEPW